MAPGGSRRRPTSRAGSPNSAACLANAARRHSRVACQSAHRMPRVSDCRGPAGERGGHRTGKEAIDMGKGSGKRATRKRVADVSAVAREDAEQLKRATRRRLARLEKDLAAVRKTEDRRRSRLAAASSKADRIRREIARLIRHASEPVSYTHLTLPTILRV